MAMDGTGTSNADEVVTAICSRISTSEAVARATIGRRTARGKETHRVVEDAKMVETENVRHAPTADTGMGLVGPAAQRAL